MRTLLRIGVLISLALFLGAAPSALFGQNVLIWDNDNGSDVRNPDTGEMNGCQVSLQGAMSDIGVTPTVLSYLPTDLTSYDVMFVTLGVWCLLCGSTPPGAVSVVQQEALVDFLEAGKGLYIEGVDVGSDHWTTTFFDYLGCEYFADDSGDIDQVVGADDTWMQHLEYVYNSYGEADHSVDALGPGNGFVFQETGNQINCGVAYIHPTFNYHVLTSSIIFGAYTDGEGPNTKAMQMARYMSFLTGTYDQKIGCMVDAIDFGEVYVGYPTSENITIYNAGLETLEITGISTTSNDFAVENAAHLLGPGEPLTIDITCTPSTVGVLSEQLIITSNDANGDFVVDLTINSLHTPDINVSATSLTAELAPGGVDDSQSFTISNNGQYNLDYSIEIRSVQSRGSGGPDTFGYVWKDSNEPDGPSYEWVDISSTGTQATDWTPAHWGHELNEGYAGPFDLGFDFYYYGVVYDEIYINSNGYVGFDLESVNREAYANYDIPATSGPNNAIYLFWDDMDGRNGGAVYTQQVGDEFVMQWSGWPLYGSQGETVTMQLRLNSRSVIDVLYGSCGSSDSATIGFENARGNDGLCVAHLEDYATNGLAWQAMSSPEWFVLDNYGDTIGPGESVEINAGFMALDLAAGVYQAEMKINTNDPATPTVQIPVTLAVNGGGEVSVTFDVSCNNSFSPMGAEITISHHDQNPDHVYTGTVPVSGELVFPTVVTGYYELEATLDGYDVYIENDTPIVTSTQIDIELIETIYAPANLQTESTDEGLMMTWDGPPARPLVEYNIYLDGTRFTNTHNDYFLWAGLSAGTHMVGVSCQYGTGESDLIETQVEIVGVNGGDVPAMTTLNGVYPNPFNPTTTVAFSLAQAGEARLDVFNMRGQKVRTLHEGALPAGDHQTTWNGRDDTGAACASGLYFVRMQCGGYHAIEKAVLLK